MKYREINYDLFEVNESYINSEESDGKPYQLAHCISADFGMMGGIVVGFNQRWNMKNRLIKEYGNAFEEFNYGGGHSIPITVENSQGKEFMVYNLITKKSVVNRPSYMNIFLALESMKLYMVEYGQTKLAMPQIGCGIDGKSWEVVSDFIKDVFNDTDIEILICKID